MRDFVIGASCGIIAGLTIVVLVSRPGMLDGIGIWLIHTLADLA